jgi:hypothetical protein
MIFGWPTFKLRATPPFSINFRCQIENQVSDYRLLGASSYMIISTMNNSIKHVVVDMDKFQPIKSATGL